MGTLKKTLKRIFRDYKEFVFFIVFFVIFYIISTYLDIFEKLYYMLTLYEPWELDEIIGVAAVSFIAVFFFSLYRSIKLRKEINERKKVEHELESTVEKLELMLESLPVALYSCKTEGNFGTTYVSDNVRKISGYEPKDFTSNNSFWADNIHPDQKPHVLKNINELLDKGSHEYEYLWRTADGSYKWFYDYSKLIKTPNDKDNLIVGMWQDVTNRKMMEERLGKSQKLESLGILAGGIAHDFNNLLTSIMSNLSIAKIHPNTDNELLTLFLETEEAAVRASDLVTQLLTFSKGGSPIKKPISDFSGFIKTVANFTLSGSNVKCEFDIEDNLWGIEADQGQISQVIQNLVLNAQQAMPEGGTIKVGISKFLVNQSELIESESGKYLKIAIEDSGIGIPEENLQKVFDPYFTTKEKGHGLGLSSVYSIVNNHKGCIDVTSQPGKQTKFEVFLPASDKPSETFVKTVNNISEGRGKILLMDDENLIKIATGRMLKKLGYEVEFASDGEEAVNKYKQSLNNGGFDLVIMDLTIPGGMGGCEATKILRSIDPDVKVVVSSGYSNDPVMSEYKKYGFVDIVKKPYNVKALSSTIENVLNGKTH